jgi:hypothetical protein
MNTKRTKGASFLKMDVIRSVRRGVSKGLEDGHRPPALQGVVGSGMAGSAETLGSPWIPFAIRGLDVIVSQMICDVTILGIKILGIVRMTRMTSFRNVV